MCDSLQRVMPDGTLYVGGAASFAFGGLFWALSWTYGRYAEKLKGVKRLHSLREAEGLLELLPLLVAVEGSAWTDHPVDCELTDRAAIISKVEEHQNRLRRVNGREAQDTQRTRTTKREARWYLKDGSHVRLPVIGGAAAAHLELELAGTVTDHKSDPLQQLGKLLDYLNSAWVVQSVQKTEHILPRGTSLTAVGELDLQDDSQGDYRSAGAVQARPGLVLALKAPVNGPFVLTTQSLTSFIAQQQQWSSVYRHCATGCFAVGVAIILFKAVRKLRIYRWQRKVPAGACAVCWDAAPDMVFPSCGHLCACSECARRLNACPLCRQPSRAIRVYQH